MAKIRIYELARDLNMKNKALLDKLKDMGVQVASHMSSIDEETAGKIKGQIFGKKVDVVEETRVKPTVIRRRKKVVKEKTPPPEVLEEVEDAEEPVVEEEAVPPPAEEQEETAAEKVEVKKKAERTPVLKIVKKQVVPEETIPAAPPVEEETEPESEIQEAPEVAEEASAEAAAIEKEAPEEEAAESPDAEEQAPAAPPVEPETPALEEEPVAASPAAPVSEETEPSPVPEKPKETPAPKEPPKSKKAQKKARKDTPAKIIKLATPPPPQEKKKEEAGSQQQSREDGRPGKEVKGKKGRKIQEESELEKKFFKKKISFRRKAVVEGDALYAKGPRGRKGRKGAKGKAVATGQKTQITTAKAIKRRVKIDDTIILSELAKRMGIKAGEMIKKLMGMGVMATVNQTIDYDTAALVAAEFDYEVERASFEEETILKIESDDPEKMSERPPVVTIMGHVDHGKTSLLDVIRESRITDDEAGGITQHIGAYHVNTDKGRIVFLDTPGHEAFTAMRLRGASITDLVVLVVAADDGVMPQTIEAINHSKAAEVPIIVAVNKIDKANADPDRVKRQLAEAGLTPEDWGGDTIFVHVSAKQKTGIDDLLEMISLQAEVLELKANPDKLAAGHVVEAKLDAGRGPVATVLVQDGTLHVHDAIVCGVHYGKIRALVDDRGRQVAQAGPSMPVEIIGLSGVPNAGDELIALEDEKDAKQVSLHRVQKQRSKELAKTTRVSLENLFDQMQEHEVKELNLVLKADVHGSIEALTDSLVKLSNEEVKINVISSATGAISESDVTLAAVSNAIIIGFNVRPNAKVQALSTEENVDIRYYNIIYNVIKDVKDAIVGLMESRYEEHVLGLADVRQVFHVPKIGAIAGSYVTNGKIQRNQKVRLIREGVVLYEGKIGSLRRFKDDAKEVASGYECGIGIENYNDIKVGDTLECFYLEEIRPTV